MYKRVVFLLLVNLFLFFPNCSSSSELDLDHFLRTRINGIKQAYSEAHENQSNVYGRWDTFEKTRVKVEIVLQGYMEKVIHLPAAPSKSALALDQLDKKDEVHTSNLERSELIWSLIKDTPTREFDCKSNVVTKLRKNFAIARELLKNFNSTLEGISQDLHSKFPGYQKNTYLQATRIWIGLFDWKATLKTHHHKRLNVFNKPEFIKALLEDINQTGKFNLIQFVCPPVDFSFLSSKNPEEYFLVSVENCLLTRQMPYLINLIKNFLVPTNVPIRMFFWIGSNDEDRYVWPIVGKPKGLDEEKLNYRRQEYLSNLKRYVEQKLIPDGEKQPSIEIQVFSLHEYKLRNASQNNYAELSQAFSKYCESYFTAEDHINENERMWQLAQPGGYYQHLVTDPHQYSKILPGVIKAKFLSYAEDGLIAFEIAPSALLLQTEFPPQLRTKMLNAGRSLLKRGLFSAIYLLDEKTRDKDKIIFPSSLDEHANCFPEKPSSSARTPE